MMPTVLHHFRGSSPMKMGSEPERSTEEPSPPAAPKTSPPEDDDDVLFDPSLFVCTSYKVMPYEVDGITQELLCSQAATTDHDLTGQVVWPVSIFLSWFVARNRGMFEGKDVLELGAGCGLSGLVASRFARRTLLTDGHETVVELLERNAERQREQHGVSVRASQLEWGCSPEELQAALRYEDEEGERLQGSSSSFRPQVLLGADVVCWPDAVVPFVQTVRALLLQAPDPGSAALYLGLVVRATSTERLFRQALSEHGLTLRPIEPSAFLPDPRPDNTVSNMQLHLLVVQMAADPRATAQGEQEQSKS